MVPEVLGWLLLVLLLPAATAASDTPPQWGALRPGPFTVGYTTIRVTDVSRTYFEDERPLQIYAWYPAAVSPGTPRMPYREYFDDTAQEWGPGRAALLRQHVLAEFRSGALQPSFSGAVPDARVESVLQTPTAVVRDAPPAPGRFPVVLHVPGLLAQSVMLEFLASHGYVVLSLPMYNTAPAFHGRGENTAAALLAMTEDLALVLAEAARLPFADTRRAAGIGMLAGVGLSLQMRGEPLRALACLDCNWDEVNLRRLPYYDPRRVRIPILELLNSDRAGSVAASPGSVVDELHAAVRYTARFQALAHQDFYPFSKVAAAPFGTPTPHDTVLFVTLQFLDAVLKDDPAGRGFLENPNGVPGVPPGAVTIRRRAADNAMPTDTEFLGWLRFGDMARARTAWDAFGPRLTTRDRMFTTVLFLARDDAPNADEAVAMFRRGFPVSGNDRARQQDELLTRLLSARRR